jgi:hypothetical protein
MADPAIVLVHGAFTVGDADYTRCVIEQIEGPVVTRVILDAVHATT